MKSRYNLARHAGWSPSVAQRILPDGLLDWLGHGPRWPVYIKDNQLTFDRRRNDGFVFPVESVEGFDCYTAMSEFHVYAADVKILHTEPAHLPRDGHDVLTADPCIYLHCQMGNHSDPLSEDGLFNAIIVSQDTITTPRQADLLIHCKKDGFNIVKNVLRMYK